MQLGVTILDQGAGGTFSFNSSGGPLTNYIAPVAKAAPKSTAYNLPSDVTGKNTAAVLPYEAQTVTDDAYTRYGTGLRYDPLDFRIQEDKYAEKLPDYPLQPLDGIATDDYRGIMLLMTFLILLKARV